MKKTIISAILATTFAGMVFAAGAPMASAASTLGTQTGSTTVNILAGGITLDTVPSFNYGAITDTQAGFTSSEITSASKIQVTDLRGASLPWYVTASAGDLSNTNNSSLKLLTSEVSVAVADGTDVDGSPATNIYSSDGSSSATVANGGTTATATTQSGDVTSTLAVSASSNLQIGTYAGSITYTLVDSDPSEAS